MRASNETKQKQEQMKMKSLRVIFVLIATIGLMVTQHGVAAAIPPNVQILPVSAGVVFLDLDNAHVGFCTFVYQVGPPPNPLGQCITIGSVGPIGPAGFSATPVGTNVFINNKNTGAIFQCVAQIVNTTPSGSCKQIGTTFSF